MAVTHAQWQFLKVPVNCRHPGRPPKLSAGPFLWRCTVKLSIDGVRAPDSRLARDIGEFVRDVESPLLFHHSSRVYYWAALTGRRRGLSFDPELLYAGAMFHDVGLTEPQRKRSIRGGRSERRTRISARLRHRCG
jgi:hypothetical protein